jgi:hypothetical protein
VFPPSPWSAGHKAGKARHQTVEKVQVALAPCVDRGSRDCENTIGKLVAVLDDGQRIDVV